MCGIAATFSLSGAEASLAPLQAMTARMVHRGPDDEGFACHGPAGLGMRRLSIIDVGGGHQPIANEDGTIWLVLNGEIYNYVELRAALKQRGHQFSTGSDAEVIIHLYEEKGVAAVDDLNGMFGFALWDSRRNLGWVARDRLGIKPIFMAATADRLVVASDLSAIRALVSARLSRASILQYLALGYVPTPDTIFEGITKLPPGHYAVIQDGRVSTRRYWDPEAAREWRGGLDDARDQLDALLHDAVRLEMRSDVPVGIFLSGGLDSSAVVAMAAAATAEPLRTLTIDFAGKGGRDAGSARLVAERFGTRHTAVVCDAARGLAALSDLVGRLDEPVADSAMIPTFILSDAARQMGIKVLLSGAGGDEIFGGYGRHQRPRVGSPDWIATALPGPLPAMTGALWSLFDSERGLRAADQRMAWATGISGASLALLKETLREPGDFDAMRTAAAMHFDALPGRRRARGYAYGGMLTDLQTYLVDDVLALGDKATMAASVEGRVPLLDHRLVEFAYALPPALNMHGGAAKGLFVEVLRRYLPADVLDRPKEGFNAPMSEWIGATGAGDPFERDLLDAPSPAIAEVIDINRLRRALSSSPRTSRTAETVFSLYVLNSWARAHLGSAAS